MGLPGGEVVWLVCLLVEGEQRSMMSDWKLDGTGDRDCLDWKTRLEFSGNNREIQISHSNLSENFVNRQNF